MAWKPNEVRLFAGKTAAPDANDDMNDGYEVGDNWIDETNNNSYQCQDNTVGSAVWAQIDLGGGVGSGSMTTVKENNVQVGGADIVTLDFLGEDFNLTEAPDTEINVALNVGIADNKVLKVDDADAADNDYAKFTPSGLEGRGPSEVLGDLSGQAAAAFDMNAQKISNVGSATEINDAATLEDVLNNAEISLNYWLMPSSILGDELTISSAYETEEITTTPQTLIIEFKSLLVETPTPFDIIKGSIILTHIQAKVAAVAGTKPVTLHTELYYVDSDGTSNPVQIGVDSDETAELTETPTIYDSHIHVANETIVPLDKRLWLKFVATTIGGTGNPTVWIYNGTGNEHVVLPVSGTVLGRFIPKQAFSQNSGVLVGTADGAYVEETGATLRTSLGLTIGTNVLAEQTIGIADNNLVEVDQADAASGETVRLTASGIESRSNAEMKTQLGYIEDVVDDTTPQLGGPLDLNEKAIDLTTGLADTKYEGFTATFTAGENVTIGELCYFKPGDSKMWQADGDALATTTGILAIATTTISADASGVFLLWGFIRDDGIFAYTAGDELYVSLTPGIPTATIPPTAGDFVRVIGYAITADVIMFNPSNDICERV